MPKPKHRLNIYLDCEWMDALNLLAKQRRVSKSSIVEAAVASLLTPDSADTREAAFVRRLDRMSRQLDKLDRDVAISTEAIALFVRYWLTVTPAQSDELRKAAEASAQSRFAGFVATLARRLASGQRLNCELDTDHAHNAT
jgi:hypothetical protein